MNFRPSLIEPATFGTLAAELRCPFSDYDYLVHVRQRSLLLPLAEHLAPLAARGPLPPADLQAALAGPLRDGTVRLSSWQPLDLPDPRQLVTLHAVPRRARCDTVRLPPCYLVHTPGLFEGTLVQAHARSEPVHHAHVHSLRPFKL